MTAIVIPFSSRSRPEPPPTETCQACPCRPGYVCRSHRVSNLATTVRAHREHHGQELLTMTADVDVVLAHVLDVLDGITAETYPANDRSVMR